MRTRRDNGAVLVEYAFAVPILLVMVVAGLAFLWAAFIQVAAGQAAREGARYASVATPPLYRTHPDAQAVVDRMQKRAPFLHLTVDDVTITYPDCAAPCSSVPSNGPVVVTVRKALPSPLRPFAKLFSAGDSIVASSEGEVRAE